MSAAIDVREVERLLKAFVVERGGEDRYFAVEFSVYEAANQIQAGKRGWNLAQVYDALFELCNRRVLVEQGQRVDCATRTFHFEAPADRHAAGAPGKVEALEQKRKKAAEYSAKWRDRERAAEAMRQNAVQRSADWQRRKKAESAPCTEGAPCERQPEGAPCSRVDTGELSEANGERGVSLAANESGKAATPVGAERESDRSASSAAAYGAQVGGSSEIKEVHDGEK